MFQILTLARQRFRSPDDYRKMQGYIAERAVAELEARGIDLGACDVLETAAGSGGYSKVLNSKARSLLANDLSPDPFFERNGINFQAFDLMQPFPLAADRFDLIYSSSVIEHVPQPARFLAECRRVLRPDGTLYLSFPPFYSLAMIGAHGYQPFHFLGERLAVAMYNRRRKRHVTGYADTWDTFGLYPLTIAAVARLLADNGFRVTDRYTRMLPINTALLPGILKDLFTWHVCFLARKSESVRA